MIRRLVFALALCLCALPARATEILINYPSKAALVQLATALGYYDPVAKAIVAQARLDAGGSYYFNNVGQVVAVAATYDNSAFPPTQISAPVMAPGLWARLRHNADPTALQAKIAAAKSSAQALGISIYQRLPLGVNNALCWSADGLTCGMAYLDTIGVIM